MGATWNQKGEEYKSQIEKIEEKQRNAELAVSKVQRSMSGQLGQSGIVAVSGVDSDTATIVSLPSPNVTSSSSGWSPNATIEERLNEEKIKSLRAHPLRCLHPPPLFQSVDDSEEDVRPVVKVKRRRQGGARVEADGSDKLSVKEETGRRRIQKRKMPDDNSVPSKKKKVDKCRKLHGHDHKELWCKPCTLSKKCIKYI